MRFVGVNVRARDAHKLGALPVVADAKLALRALADALGRLAARRTAWRERARDGARALGAASSPRTSAPRDRRAHDAGRRCCGR